VLALGSALGQQQLTRTWNVLERARGCWYSCRLRGRRRRGGGRGSGWFGGSWHCCGRNRRGGGRRAGWLRGSRRRGGRGWWRGLAACGEHTGGTQKTGRNEETSATRSATR